MANRRKRKSGGISWELLGIVAILGVFLVAFIFAVAMPEDRIQDAGFSSLDPSFKGEGEPAEVIAHGFDEDERYFLGEADAPVTAYEFADFQCPHCREFTLTVGEDIKRDYLATGQVKLVWVNTAFLGPESEAAAIAANCAGEQDLFWPMHDILFENQATVYNQGGFSRDRLVEMGERIGADPVALRDCLDDPAMLERIRRDRDFVTESGIESTPSFRVGERVVVGSDGMQLRQVLDEALP